MHTKKRTVIIDVIIGLISVGLGAGAFYLTFGFQVGASSGLASGMNAAFYPRLIASILMVLGAVLILQSRLASSFPILADEDLPESGKSIQAIFKIFPLVIAFTLALPVIGYFAATAILVVILLFIVGEYRPLWLVGVTVLVVASFFVLFRYGFNIVPLKGYIWGALS